MRITGFAPTYVKESSRYRADLSPFYNPPRREADTKNFIKSFRRDDAGTWVCIHPAEVTLPEGRIQVTPGTRFARGTRFMNVEIAALLEDEYRRGKLYVRN